jgi:5-oxoprolinase (ATP-hydrolysing)
MGIKEVNVYECALGFIKVANETMSRPIRSLTQARGFNPKNHILDIFGGAGAQHACSIARELGIKKIYVHKYCGILSAYGLGLADVVREAEEPIQAELT